MALITLITDYGTRDYYVGALKGVILGIAPDVRIVDVTHEIEPHNVLHAAFVLRQIWPWYPVGTVHLAVVDPGVGSGRRIVLGRYGGRCVIAPDNGLVTFVHRDLPAEAMHVVENRRFFLPDPSITFHGRDLMAPVAAHLANGVKPSEFGPGTDRFEMLPISHGAEVTTEGVRGSVVYVDHFGTFVTNILPEQVAERGGSNRVLEVRVNGKSIGPVRSTFCDVSVGEPIALIGSCGLLEIAVNQGRAVDTFGLPDTIRIDVC